MQWRKTILSDDTGVNVSSFAYGNGYYIALNASQYVINIMYTQNLQDEWIVQTIKNSGADPITTAGIVFDGSNFVVPYTTTLTKALSALYFETPTDTVTDRVVVGGYTRPIALNSVQYLGGEVVVCGARQEALSNAATSAYVWHCADPAGDWYGYRILEYTPGLSGNTLAAVYDTVSSEYQVYVVAKQDAATNIHRIYTSPDLATWSEPRTVATDTLASPPHPAFAYCENYDAIALFLHGRIYVSKAGQAFTALAYPAGIEAESIRTATSDGTKFLAPSASLNQASLKVIYSSGDPTVAENWRVQTLSVGTQVSPDAAFLPDINLFIVLAGANSNILKPAIYTAVYLASDFNMMRDRVPTYPGRVSLTPTGQQNVYTLVREDDPTEVGTKLSKVNLLSDDAALAVWNNTPPNVLCTPSTALEHLGNNAFHVGDILTTARDLSGDTNWLKCTGGDVSEQDYPELYAILETATIDDNWHNSSIATTDTQYAGMATDGEWFVILRLIGNGPYTLNILYTRDPSGAWENKNIGPQCTQYNWLSFQYANGEFTLFCTGPVSSSAIPIYTVHAADPSGEWTTTQITNISASTYSSAYVKGWTYADNKYVLGVELSPIGGTGYTVALCYSNTLDGNYQTNWAFYSSFSGQSVQQYLVRSAPAYGNGQWALSVYHTTINGGSTMYYNNIFYSSDIATLNSSSSYLTCDASSDGINTVDALVYGNGYWVGLRDANHSLPRGIIYSTDDLASSTFVPITDIGWSNDINILFFNNRFIFISASASVSSQKKIWYTSDPSVWESAVMYDGPAYIAFQTVSASTQNSTIFTTLKTAQSLVPIWHIAGKSLPKLSPGVGLNAYIKAKEGD